MISSPLIFISSVINDLPYSIMEVDARTFEYTIYGDIQNFGIVHWACPLRLVQSRDPHLPATLTDVSTGPGTPGLTSPVPSSFPMRLLSLGVCWRAFISRTYL